MSDNGTVHPRMAIDNPAGDPRPQYDQYALNDPDSLDKQAEGQVEQEIGVGGTEKGFAAPEFASEQQGDVLSTEASRARADADRPLGKD